MDPSVLSNFDPNSFLDSSIETVLVSRPPLPAGRVFVALLGEPKMSKWQNKEGTKAGLKATIPHEFDVASLPPEVQSLYAAVEGGEPISKITLNDDIMLDTVEVDGQLILDTAPGKNGRLRSYREATGLNSPGQTFNLRMLQGRQVQSKIKHEPYEGNIYDKIAAVAKLG